MSIESHCTVRAVFCQDAVADTVCDVVSKLLSDRVAGVYCKTGYHRAATVAEAACALLNYTGHQVLHLALAADLPGDLGHSVELAIRWVDNPWAEPQTALWPQLKAKTLTRPEAWAAANVLEVSGFTHSTFH